MKEEKKDISFEVLLDIMVHDGMKIPSVRELKSRANRMNVSAKDLTEMISDLVEAYIKKVSDQRKLNGNAMFGDAAMSFISSRNTAFKTLLDIMVHDGMKIPSVRELKNRAARMGGIDIEYLTELMSDIVKAYIEEALSSEEKAKGRN